MLQLEKPHRNIISVKSQELANSQLTDELQDQDIFPEANSAVFLEGNYPDLKSFFNEHEYAHEQIARTQDFIKTMRESLRDTERQVLSFGHDKEGTITVVSMPPNHELTEDSRNKVHIVRYNPLDAKHEPFVDASETQQYDDVELVYVDGPNEARTTIEDQAGNLLIVSLYGNGKPNNIQKIGHNPNESWIAPIIDTSLLDYTLAYNHPANLSDKIAREERAKESNRRAYHGL